MVNLSSSPPQGELPFDTDPLPDAGEESESQPAPTKKRKLLPSFDLKDTVCDSDEQTMVTRDRFALAEDVANDGLVFVLCSVKGCKIFRMHDRKICREHRNEQRSQRRAARRKAGQCASASCPRPVIPGMVLCDKCGERERDRRRQRLEKEVEKKALLALTCSVDGCDETPTDKRRICIGHVREQQVKARAAKKLVGICQKCNELAGPGQKSCANCLVKDRERRRRTEQGLRREDSQAVDLNPSDNAVSKSPRLSQSSPILIGSEVGYDDTMAMMDTDTHGDSEPGGFSSSMGAQLAIPSPSSPGRVLKIRELLNPLHPR
ncbi:hypothetical protein BJ170DRAFT_641553 [Xylariales sp. AK1849]|nr:hypothetical protein BJ170DRAFT_641553 [Xylariales sp. AK1849]